MATSPKPIFQDPMAKFFLAKDDVPVGNLVKLAVDWQVKWVEEHPGAVAGDIKLGL